MFQRNRFVCTTEYFSESEMFFQAEILYDSFERLVDPEQMGERYKALCLIGAKQSVPPGGFSK